MLSLNRHGPTWGRVYRLSDNSLSVIITSDVSAKSDGLSAKKYITTRLMLAVLMSVLDYCNAALAGLYTIGD